MPDSPEEQLLARASGDWSIFAELWTKPADERLRRELLRFHRERGITDKRQIDLRHRLDNALDRVCTLELGVEIGLLTEADAAFEAIPHLKQLLSESPAFVRYADNYLNLSLRFVAERLHVARPEAEALNLLPVARPVPPPVNEVACRSEAAALSFVAMDPLFDAPDVKAALQFLDDFSLEPGPEGRKEAPGSRVRGMGPASSPSGAT